MPAFVPFAIILLLVIGIALSAIRIMREYERAVMFTLGRFSGVKGPGLIVLIPFVQQIVRVDLRTIVLDVPSQDVISRDNVSVKVNAVLYFRVVDADKAIIQVENFMVATSQLAQTTLRSVLGKHELDEMLAERDKLNLDIREILDSQTDAWGIKVANVEIKHVDINESMIRAIARQAEAERNRRARIISAEAEQQAAQKLVEAANILAVTPEAMQLRYLLDAARHRDGEELDHRLSDADRPAARADRPGSVWRCQIASERSCAAAAQDRGGNGQGMRRALAALSRNEARRAIGPDGPVIDPDIPAAAGDELGAFDGREDRHRMLAQSLLARIGLCQRQHLRDPADIHRGEPVDLGSDLRREVVEFRAHDAAQAHAIIVGESRAKDLGVSVHAPCRVIRSGQQSCRDRRHHPRCTGVPEPPRDRPWSGSDSARWHSYPDILRELAEAQGVIAVCLHGGFCGRHHRFAHIRLRFRHDGTLPITR